MVGSRAGLYDFIPDVGTSDRGLVVINSSAPEPIERMLFDLFDDQSIDVTKEELPDADDDLVAAVEDGEILATSPIAALEQSILMVNSDLFKTGARDLEEIDLPDAIANLDDVPFRLRGYPESHLEKLLLIVISRHIERVAWEQGDGRLRASFQHLSRVNDERGTRRVYERLAASAVDVHVYGMLDWTPPPEMSVTAHGGYDADFRDGWFVVYTPSGGASESDGDEAIALVAVEVAPNEWEGFWTYDVDRVREVNRYIERHL